MPCNRDLFCEQKGIYSTRTFVTKTMPDAGATFAATVAANLVTEVLKKPLIENFPDSHISRFRSLELQLVNATSDHNFTWGDEGTDAYFHRGCFYTHPTQSVVLPNSCTVATVSNKNMCPTGVDGAIAFRIDDTNNYLVIGFWNSFWPSEPGHVILSKSKEELKDVFGKIRNGTKHQLKRFSEFGFKIESKLANSSVCDRKILIIITKESKLMNEAYKEIGRHLSKDHICFGDG